MPKSPERESAKQERPFAEPASAEMAEAFDQTIEKDALTRRLKELSTRMLEESASNPDNAELLALEIDKINGQLAGLEKAPEAPKAQLPEAEEPMVIETAGESSYRMNKERWDRMEAMAKRVDASMEAEDRINAMIQEELDKERQRSAELSVKLAKNNAKQAELSNDIAGIAADIQKAAADKNFEPIAIYASSVLKMKEDLASLQMESIKLQTELSKLSTEPLETVQDVILLTPDMIKPIEVTDDMIIESRDLTAEEKGEAKEIVEKNELPPQQKEALEKEAKVLSEEVAELKKDLFEGYTSAVGEKVPGLETKLMEQFKIDPEKMSVSSMERFKVGLKTLFNAEARKTLREYKSKLGEYNSKNGDLQDTQFAIRDPKGYAKSSFRSLMKWLGLGAKARMGTRGGGGPLGRGPAI